MAPNKKQPGKWRGRRPRARAKKSVSMKTGEAGLRRRLAELTEQIDIVLPEVTARVAALEHLLVERHLCTHDDLRQARTFMREQEA